MPMCLVLSILGNDNVYFSLLLLLVVLKTFKNNVIVVRLPSFILHYIYFILFYFYFLLAPQRECVCFCICINVDLEYPDSTRVIACVFNEHTVLKIQ
jgi:hypothetical protein